MMGDAVCEAAMVLDGLRRRRRHGEVADGDSYDGGRGEGGGGWVSGSGAAGSSAAATAMSSGGSSTSSFFSSTSSVTDEDGEGDDGATSSSRPDREVSSSSLSSLTSSGSETTTQIAGPLYALSTMLEDLPALRTGLSKHYQGKSQSFTSLADVSCVEDLAKKTTPYIRRKKAPRRYAPEVMLGAKNRLSKTIAKKAPRGKPPACQGKREMYRC